MKYVDGVDMQLGDRVKIINGETGTIVASMDTNEYMPEYKDEFEYYKTGIMVRTDKGALVRFEEEFPQQLVSRLGE